MTSIDTARLRLRPIGLDDVDTLVELNRDAEVMRYINGGKASSRQEVEDAVRRAIGHRWMAHDRASGAFVGWFGIRPGADNPADRELGYRLRRAMWGNGYATEGSRALLALAFDGLGAERVWGQTMTVNAASRRVMERLGMRFVRTFHLEWDEPIEGTELGDVEYELREPEYRRPTERRIA